MQSVKCAAKTLLALTVCLPGLAFSANEWPTESSESFEAPLMTSLEEFDKEFDSPGIYLADKGNAEEVDVSLDALLAEIKPVKEDIKEPMKEDMEIEGMGLAISTSKLDGYRGGTDVKNTVIPEGFVTDNAAVHVVTGTNSISGASFANASGIPVVIQNSGANVLIQNATLVNVQLK